MSVKSVLNDSSHTNLYKHTLNMSFGYDIANAYARWVWVNQFRVAKMRVQESLMSCIKARHFVIPVKVKTLGDWSNQTAPLLAELLRAENASGGSGDVIERLLLMGMDDIENISTLIKNRAEILEKYLGKRHAEKFITTTGIRFDAYGIMNRLHTYFRVETMYEYDPM